MKYTTSTRTLFVLALALIAHRNLAYGQRVEDSSVSPDGANAFVQFGTAVAADGEWSIVCDYNGRTPTLESTGSCVIYRRTEQGLMQWQTLFPSTTGFVQRFGHSVALHGDELVVSAVRGGQDNSGRVFVFRLQADQWVETQVLAEPSGGSGFGYGGSVSFDANTLVVGSPFTPDETYVNGARGTCYVYKRGAAGWELSERIPLPDHTSTPHGRWNFFGSSCAVEGDRIVIGAPLCDAQGMAFTYRKINARWQPETELYLPQFDPNISFCLGDCVDVSGGTIAVGAPVQVGAFSPGASSVWMFDYDQQLQQWVFAQTLRASDWNLAQGGDQFGTSLDLHGDRLLVGAERGGLNGPLSGTAYIFERNGGTWAEVERLIPSDPNPYPTQSVAPSTFGSAVAMDAEGNRILVGAHDAWSDTYQDFRGKAYLYDLNQGTVVCAGFPNLTGVPTRLTVTGNRTVNNANLSLTVHDAPAGYMGLFLVGPGGPATPFGAGGSLCVGQPFSRLTGIQTIGPEGSAMHQVDFIAEPAASLIQPGTTLTFQFAHRDLFFLNGAQTINASQAVEVLFE